MTDYIRYVDREEWTPNVLYQNNGRYVDTISFNGCTYYCKMTHTNQIPSDSKNNIYWGFLSRNEGNDMESVRRDLDRIKKLLYNINRTVRSGFEEFDDRMDDLENKLKADKKEE